MERPDLNFTFESKPRTSVLADPASSTLQRGNNDSEQHDSHWARHSSIPSFPTIESPAACTFIFPSRKRPSRTSLVTSDTLRSLKLEKEVCTDSVALPPDHSTCISPCRAMFPEQASVLSESSSCGTFGGISSWGMLQTITVSSPDMDSIRPPFCQRSPLNQLFIPPMLSTPMVECFSVSLADSSTVLTPIEEPFPTNAPRTGEEANHLTSSSTRASLFTISAYSRMDNMKTPLMEIGQTAQGLSNPVVEPRRRLPFLSVHPAVSVLNMAQDHQTDMMPASASSSSIRRTHRPVPLTLGRDIVQLSHPMVGENVSQGTSSSAGHANSNHSSNLEENPMRRAIGRATLRYNQASAAPSLPVVEAVKRVYVELRIDQEEHRTIRPQFTFKRHIAKPTMRPKTAAPRLSTAFKEPEAFWDSVSASGLVDFRMSAREVGTFHCGTISREAVLRRVVVDGEDHRDHLTANVVLPLKENGVYTVHGMERERRKSNPQILVWKFEYTVEDKRQAGKPLIGEKLLRPISFICSPELLLPSQGSGVTIMHLLSKKIVPSPTATRIPPPAIPMSLPVSAISAVFDRSDTDFTSTRKRKSRLVTVVKSLSRPTTPATDPRLRNDTAPLRPGSSFGRRPSVARSHRSEATADSQHRPTVAHSKFILRPLFRRSSSYMPSLVAKSPGLHPIPDLSLHQWPQKWTMNLGKSIDSLHLSATSGHRRPHTIESSSPRRPHTAGFALGKSFKHMSSALTGSMAPRNHHATAGSQVNRTVSSLSRPEKSSLRLTLGSLGHDSRGGDTLPLQAAAPSKQLVWHMPTDEDIDEMLEKAERLVMSQQYRLDILVRSRSSKHTSIERMDSSGGITMQSDGSSPPHKVHHHFTGQPIASPRTLQILARPGGTPRRPSTTNGTLGDAGFIRPTTNRSLSQAILKRPHTSDGSHQDATLLDSRSRNGSAVSLGLPYPPRKLRG